MSTEQPKKKQKMDNISPVIEDSGNPGTPDKEERDPRKCHFYVTRKKRYCKVDAYKETKYCVEHAQEAGVVGTGLKNRIPCPYDSKHSCYESQLYKHKKKCNARPGLNPPCYVENINSGDNEGEDPATYKVSIRNVTDEDILQLVKTVNKLHSEHIGEIEISCLFHEVLQTEADKPMNGPAAQKHIKQQASLIGHMKDAGLLDGNRTYIEFGAGKGGLSHWVQLAMSTYENNQYILIDKSAVRYRMDTYHKGIDQGPSFERLKLDIQNLHLGKVASLQNDTRPIVGYGKHLCGGATDLMLRCLVETTQMTDHPLSSSVHGLVLALCCHHRCDWHSYCGKEFFRQCGLSAQDFHLVTSMTSWATCASKHVAETDSTKEHDHPKTYNHHRYGNLLPQEREEIGRKCKQLIDRGRVNYLISSGYKGRHVVYVDKAHTLENMAIIATNMQTTSTST